MRQFLRTPCGIILAALALYPAACHVATFAGWLVGMLG